MKTRPLTTIQFVASLEGEIMSPDPEFARAAHTLVVDALALALSRGQAVNLPGVGTISVVPGAARKGMNPKTGERIIILAKPRLKLRTCEALSEALQQLPI